LKNSPEEIMRRILSVFVFITILSTLLSACAGGAADGAPKAIESYLQALVAEDQAKVVSLSCAEWEESARLEVDSFQGVKAALEGAVCTETGTEDGAALVTCQGKIVATYNNENQELPLNTRTYQAVQEGGEWRMCGYQ
jgi:hypothetical protein